MEKSLIIQRLQATVDMLDQLPEESFNFNTWVTEFDYEHNCGTVCCIAGWYPKYFPEAKLAWNNEALNRLLTDEGDDDYIVPLAEYHGISYDLAEAIFAGSEYSIVSEAVKIGDFIVEEKALIITYNDDEVTLDDAKNMFSSVITVIEKYSDIYPELLSDD